MSQLLLAQGLVNLSRQNAEKALAASSDKLQAIAVAFLDHLKSLRAQSVSACFGFISKGETSPAVVQMMEQSRNGDGAQRSGRCRLRSDLGRRKKPGQARLRRQERLRHPDQGTRQARLEGRRSAGLLESETACEARAGAGLQDGAGVVRRAPRCAGQSRPRSAAVRDAEACRVGLIGGCSIPRSRFS